MSKTAISIDRQAAIPDGLPDGCPEWIDRELLTETLDAWQPLAGRKLSDTDAIDILQRCGNLFEVVGMVTNREDNE